MRKTPEQIAQRILDRRGYLVVATLEKYKKGQILDSLNHASQNQWPDIREAKTVVVAVTDHADFMEQVRLAGHEPPSNPVFKFNYYRVVAE